MVNKASQNWFEDLQKLLEPAYLAQVEPWAQSGFSGSFERWEAVRRPIAACIEAVGSFLDIGCANGYLLECLMGWVEERGLKITPYGLDLSARLVELAKARLPQSSEQLWVGNAFEWIPPLRFDYVRTELVYVPLAERANYIKRLLNHFVKPGGKLLVAHYRRHDEPPGLPWIDQQLNELGYPVAFFKSGYDPKYNNAEMTRVAVISAYSTVQNS